MFDKLAYVWIELPFSLHVSLDWMITSAGIVCPTLASKIENKPSCCKIMQSS